MKTLQPISPRDRDPNLVLIGVPAVRGGLWDLVRTVITLELGALALEEAKVNWRFEFRKMAGQGIAKARNMLTYAARCLPVSKIVMVDADIRPEPGHFFRLLSHAEALVGALYPKKNLERLCWVGEFRDATPATIGPGGLWPMEHVGSGFVRVDMEVVDRMVAELPERRYMNDEDEPSSGIADGQWMHDFWGMGVVNGEWFGTPRHPARRKYPRYVTEDYFFSHLASSIGVKLWTDPGCQVDHVGEVGFLEVFARRDKAIAEALAQYRADLEKVGFKVPVLVRDPEGNVFPGRSN
jgi:hypothetical protein